MLKRCLPFVLLALACGSEGDALSSARLQAETFLETLRDNRWEEAADFVLLNDAARNRFGFSANASDAEVAAEVSKLFRQLYEAIDPGPIRALRVDPQGTGDTDLVLVEYRHGDLDAFHMRRIDGRWFYSFE